MSYVSSNLRDNGSDMLHEEAADDIERLEKIEAELREEVARLTAALAAAQPAPATPSAKLEEAERLIKAVVDTSFACGEYDPPDADDQQWNEGYTNLRNSNEEAKDALINFIAPLMDRSADGGEAVAPASFEQKAEQLADSVCSEYVHGRSVTLKRLVKVAILEAMQWAAQRGTVKVRMLTADEVLSAIHACGPELHGRIALTYEHGPYDIDRTSLVADRLAASIQRKFAEVNGLQFEKVKSC